MIMTLTTLLLLAPASTGSSTSAVDRAAAAAERAAVAASAAAEAAAKSAAAVEKMAASMAPAAPAAAAAPAADAPPPDAVWTSNIGAAFLLTEGDAFNVAGVASVDVERKSTDWIVGLKLQGTYGRGQGVGDERARDTSLAADAAFRTDRRFTPEIAGYGKLLGSTDHIKSVEYVVGGEAGGSIKFFDEKVDDYTKSSLQTDLGMRVSHESRVGYYRPNGTEITENFGTPTTVDTVAPRLGVIFTYAINKDAVFSEEFEALPSLIPVVNEADPAGEEAIRVQMNSLSKLSLKLTSIFSFNTVLILKYDNVPAKDRSDLNVGLTAGISLTL